MNRWLSMMRHAIILVRGIKRMCLHVNWVIIVAVTIIRGFDTETRLANGSVSVACNHYPRLHTALNKRSFAFSNQILFFRFNSARMSAFLSMWSRKMKRPCGKKKASKNSTLSDFIFGAEIIILLLAYLSIYTHLYLLLIEFVGRALNYRSRFFHFNLWRQWEDEGPGLDWSEKN